MEHLMNQLVGRSIAQERERDLAAGPRGAGARPARRRRRTRVPRHRRGATSVAAHA